MARGALSLVVLVSVVLAALAGRASAGAAKDPFEAMNVERPAQPLAAPDVRFASMEAREVTLAALRGKVVLLGFFTAT